MAEELRDSTRQPASVLVVDDDQGTRDTFNCVLTAHGLTVATAACGADALALTSQHAFDVIVLDVRLPDMVGTDLGRALHRQLPNAHLIVVSGFLTTRTTVDAVRNGAVEVMEKPVDAEHLIATVDAILQSGPVPPSLPTDHVTVAGESRPNRRSPIQRSRSAAERWAMNVLQACHADADLRTLDDWAHCVGLSYSSLCESCRLLRIRPHDARDLARVLRAIVTTCRHSHLGVHFDVSDVRTLKRLLDRAGLDYAASPGTISVEDFLQRQHFVGSDNEGLTALRKLLAARFTDR